jgi:hypothetical protein
MLIGDQNRILLYWNCLKTTFTVEAMALRIADVRGRFLELYQSGYSVARISSEMRVCTDTVRRHLRAQGVVFDPKNGGRKKKAIAQPKEGGAIT